MSEFVIEQSGHKVLFCIPVVNAHEKHIPHAMQFYAENMHKHDMLLHWELGRALHKVQNAAVNKALANDCTHVLFTEHDQWGYPVDGLDVLLDHDKDVIGLMTHMRKFPYLPMNMKKTDKNESFVTTKRNLRSFYPAHPISQTDLITWAFTLVKIDVFKRMKEAGKNPWVWDTVPTDSHFCQACEDLGIERWISPEYIINHGDLPKEHIYHYQKMFDSINASEGKLPTYAPPVPAYNDEDPHGVEPYQSQLTQILGDPVQLAAAQKTAEEFAEAHA